MTFDAISLIEIKENYIKIIDSLLDYTLNNDNNYLKDINKSFDAIKKVAIKHNLENVYQLCVECDDILFKLEHKNNDKKLLIYEVLLYISKIKYEFEKLNDTNQLSQYPLQPSNWEDSNWVQEYSNMTYTGNILIVDDDLLLLAILEKIFRKEGYRVFVSSKANDVLEIIEEHHIDVVLLDLIMPEKNGFEVFSEIKNEKPEIFVIFLTANSKIEDKVKALKAGVDGYITKPFQEQEVIANVESLLKKANIQRTSIINDSLTGAFTRKYFKQRFDEEKAKFVKENVPLSIAFLDIDHFKKINDTYGHVFGDYILKTFTYELKKQIRDTDELYRFGGDEFLILFTNTLQQDAFSVLERIRKHIESKVFSYNDIDISVSISFSAGLSMIENANEDMERLLDKADKALYVSKENGRGRTTIKGHDDEKTKAKKKILIADEINIIGNLVKSRLNTLGYSVNFAKDQNDLINKISEFSPDLIILDILLSQFNPTEAINYIFNNNNASLPKVILVSSKHQENQISYYFSLGAHDYIKKPFSLQELEQRVRRQLQ